ncbi:aldose epimerase [Puniceicoccales bacterium CK1056]|uniref:Aldose epimerase n=1 Tax=Oceanipulchritudo coccoides TaxID=2706888 RepID=A0A6B2M466_9BACT|nr:aldose epimerase [Oceanipulchritudo coccoides]NDV62440.1 aldose epimerase [Oceanipulchritudo coccoides]
MAAEENPAALKTETFELGSSTFQIAPESGFRLMRWTLSTAVGKREILHWPDSAGNEPFHGIRGGNPLLFPFAGRSFDRGLEDHWRAPGGEQLPMPRHGFARDGEFEVVSKDSHHISAKLVPDEKAKAAYPYNYTFSTRYTFEELAFTISLKLENHGEEPIPWSAGHHFYFTLPWHNAARRKDYRLNMEARKCAYHGPDGKLVMQKDRESCHDLSDTDLLDRIHWELRHNRVSFGPKGGEEDVHLIIGSEPVPQKGVAVVTWSESESAPYYCIEPWMGAPNAAEHGKGLHWVGPGECASFEVQVSLF